MGTLYKSFADYYYPQVFAKAPADPELYKKIEAAFELLDIFLSRSQYAAGNSLTIADLAFLATITWTRGCHGEWFSGCPEEAPRSEPSSTNACTSTWALSTRVFAKAPADPELYKKIEAAFELLDIFLSRSQYAAGNSLTIADLAFLATISSFEVAGFDFSKYANVAKWYAKAKTVAPGFDENWQGCLEFKKFFN
ncbi:hypothetical protein DOY81_015337 [Sarcophaga bullata]|nr:hypothetical protein DOY81_015337 [Sarcophaga bullata]